MANCGQRQLADDAKAVVRYRVRSKMEMQLLELTEGGCMLDARGWSVKPDERVLVRLPGTGEIGATVVWIEDRKAGVAFEEPLYGPVIDHIFA